jgi:ketosteroid isomerase-like protein
MPTQTMVGQSTEPRAVVQAVLDAIRAGEIERIADYLTDDIVWDVVGADYMPQGSRFEGKQAVLNDFLLGTVIGAFDFTKPIEITVSGTHVDGSTVVVEWTVSATTKRGEPYANRYCPVFEVQDGRIRAVREYCNTEYAKRLLFD